MNDKSNSTGDSILKKRTIKKIIIWLASLIIIAAVGWYFTMDYAINKMISTISFDEIPADVGEGFTTPDPLVSATPITDVSTTKPAPIPSGSTPPSSSATPIEPNATVAPTTPSPTPKYVGTIDKSKAENAQNSITLKEKTDISMILLKKLSPSDISLFTKMASGGLTIEEKKAAKKEILKKLSEEDYNHLIQIAARLGLSQGKSYQESLKEAP